MAMGETRPEALIEIRNAAAVAAGNLMVQIRVFAVSKEFARSPDEFSAQASLLAQMQVVQLAISTPMASIGS